MRVALVLLAFAFVALGLVAGLRASPGQAGGTPIMVTTTADADAPDTFCSLREAIISTNNNVDYNECVDPDGGYDAIRFDLNAGTPTINITGTPLPLIEGPVSIVGGPERVELRGPNLPNFDGLEITTLAPGTTIRRLVTSGFTGNHIEVYADDVTINGSFIGTDATGTQDMGGARGIYVQAAERTTIGGLNEVSEDACTGDCNLISGHLNGIRLESAISPVVQGNFIGTNALGTSAIPNNFWGIDNFLTAALIGGTPPGAGNLISGNGGVNGGGLTAYATQASPGALVIQGNRIGVNAAGTGAIPNRDGMYLDGPSFTRIGDGGPGSGNIISGNTRYGIEICCAGQVVIRSNLIGILEDGTALGNGSHGLWLQEYGGSHFVGAGSSTDPPNVIAFNGGDGVRVDRNNQPPPPQGTVIYGNSIYSNVGKGIENINLGNAELAPPIILDATFQGASGTGAACPSSCGVQLYSDSEDEGRIYVAEVTADISGDWAYSGTLPGPNVTATTIDTNNNTSEFSAPFTLPATPTPSASPTFAPTPTLTATPTASASPSPTPTLTPTPTATLTDTPSATPTSAAQRTWGDADCDGAISSRDNQALLRNVLGQAPLSQTEPCPDLGQSVGGRVWGDWDCDGAISSRDNQALLRAVLQQTPLSQTEPCPDIGSAA